MSNQIMPIISINDAVILPGTKTTLIFTKTNVIEYISSAINNSSEIFLTLAKKEQQGEFEAEDIHQIGVICNAYILESLDKGTLTVTFTSIKRVYLKGFIKGSSPQLAEVVDMPDISMDDKMIEAVTSKFKQIKELYVEHLKKDGTFKDSLKDYFENNSDMRKVTNAIYGSLQLDIKKLQSFLEEKDLETRLNLCAVEIFMEINRAPIKKEILIDAKKNADKHQKDYFLREQLKVIQNQLGEDTQTLPNNISEYEERIKNITASELTKEKLNKDVQKLKRLPQASAEVSVLCEYLDMVLSMPWGNKTDEKNDIEHAQEILDIDHYALTKVKERVIEYLAVRQKTNNLNSPILCLVGPPGVGKTSIAKSIAKALNRKYVRMSLGGLHDEAEIRGHRKTYLAAMPGRLITSIKSSKVDNPLILLDEIDKINKGLRGDPSAALLEVLDKEQNKTFRDNYMEIDYDISDVLFLCTANNMQDISAPLRDRLDIIELNSYTLEEKKQIALRYLTDKQRKVHGLNEDELTIDIEAIEEIITAYTKEAGVRSLDRVIEKLCRKTVKLMLTTKKEKINITKDNVSEYLGAKKYIKDELENAPQIGTVKGLAWTPLGGLVISIEVNKSIGSGKLKVTGNIGKVMDESATAALSYIKSIADDLMIDADSFKLMDIHIHIPGGAVPKDGPSAGAAITIAIISALTNRPICNYTAMTGEITIRGKILAIGGLKEKVLAAKGAGIKKIIVPKNNNNELLEMEDYVKEGLEIILVSGFKEIMDILYI